MTVFYDRDIYTETFNIAVLQAFIEKQPETIKSFLRALLKAERFVAEQPDAAQTIMASATKVELGLIKSVWDDFNYELTLDQTLLITLEDETRWAMKNRLTDQVVMPNYQQSIHMDSLAAIKPATVTLYR